MEMITELWMMEFWGMAAFSKAPAVRFSLDVVQPLGSSCLDLLSEMSAWGLPGVTAILEQGSAVPRDQSSAE